jgi:hypothetical protein
MALNVVDDALSLFALSAACSLPFPTENANAPVDEEHGCGLALVPRSMEQKERERAKERTKKRESFASSPLSARTRKNGLIFFSSFSFFTKRKNELMILQQLSLLMHKQIFPHD